MAGAASADGSCRVDGAQLAFATQVEARKMLAAPDAFTRALSAFDRAARLRADSPVSPATFLARIAEAGRSWSPKEKSDVQALWCDLSKRVAQERWKLALPPSVTLVRTSGAEEMDAAYTRGAAIFLPDAEFKPGQPLAFVLAHELFHVASRHWAGAAPAKRAMLYGLVGYAPLDAPFELPAAYRDRKITNPDSPETTDAITVNALGQHVRVVPLLFATPAEYSTAGGGSLFRYLTFRLMPIERVGPLWTQAKGDAGPTVLLDPADTDYLDQVGRNTDENFQADEVLADNFAIALRYGPAKPSPTPELLERLSGALRAAP